MGLEIFSNTTVSAEVIINGHFNFFSQQSNHCRHGFVLHVDAIGESHEPQESKGIDKTGIKNSMAAAGEALSFAAPPAWVASACLISIIVGYVARYRWRELAMLFYFLKVRHTHTGDMHS